MNDDGFEQLMALEDLPDRQPVGETLSSGEKVVLVRFGKEVFAIQECCSHADFPMEDGDVVEDFVIECALHGAQFDVRDGSVVAEPAWEPLATYEVKLEAGTVMVRVVAPE